MTLLEETPSAAKPTRNTPAIAAAAIEVHGLSHTYGSGSSARKAVDSVSLSVSRGQIFGLLGPNGSGKSTLFRVLSTLVAIQEGSVRINGFDIKSQTHAARKCLGVVFQQPALDKQLTAKENLSVHGLIHGLSGSDLTSRIQESLEMVGLSDRAHDRVSALSGGLRRRVELAKCLLTKPSVLILDEPSTGLDPSARAAFMDVLRKATSAANGQTPMTVMLTTHLMDEAEQCDRLAIVSAGRLVADGAPADLIAAIGQDTVVIQCDAPARLSDDITSMAKTIDPHAKTVLTPGSLNISMSSGLTLLTRLPEKISAHITGVSVSRPSLTDVYFKATGKLWSDEDTVPAQPVTKSRH